MPSARTHSPFALIKSEIVAVGVTIDEMRVHANKTHCFCGVQFFADANGDAEAVPLAGTVVITIQTLNTEPRFEAPLATNTIQAASPDTLSWAANTQAVKAVPSGIDVATHYRLVVTCNER